MYQWVNRGNSAIGLGRWGIPFGDFVQFNLVGGNNEWVAYLINEAGERYDYVFYYDLRCGLDLAGIRCREKVLVYRIFSFGELVIATQALPKFLQICKAKCCFIIDCYNSYLYSKYNLVGEEPTHRMELSSELFKH